MAGYPSEALTGPAHSLTGAGEALVSGGPRAVPAGAWAQERDRKASTESVAGIVDKLLPIIAKTFASTARKDTALETAWRAVVVEAVKKEAESAVQTVPFGKALLLTLRLSASFADGVGAGMAAYYEKETRGRQQALESGTDSLDANVRELQFERQYLGRAANGLSAVLTKGLVEAGVKALSLLLDAASDTLQQNVTAVARQVAKEVPKRYPVAAAFHVMVTREAKPIPEARARIERIAFSTLAESALSIFVSKRSSALLAPVFREVGGKEPVDVALLAALIRVLAQGSGETYAKYVPLGELRQMILDGARELLERVIESGMKVTEGDATSVSAVEIVVPGEILAELKAPPFNAAMRSRYWAAQHRYLSTADALTGVLATQAQLAQRQIDEWYDLHKAGGLAESDFWKRYSSEIERLGRTSRASLQVLDDLRQAIKNEFGTVVPGYGAVDDHLTLGDKERFSPATYIRNPDPWLR